MQLSAEGKGERVGKAGADEAVLTGGEDRSDVAKNGVGDEEQKSDVDGEESVYYGGGDRD